MENTIEKTENKNYRAFPAYTYSGEDVTPLDFDVYSEPIKTNDGYIIPDRKAIFRENKDTGKKVYLATVSKDYHIIKHSDIVNTVESSIKFNKDNTDIKTILSPDGKQMQRIYTLNDFQVTLRGVTANTLSPVVRVVNSYDGSAMVSFKCDCIRRICTNGMISLANFTHVAYKHFGKIDDISSTVTEQFRYLMKNFEKYSENWTKWLDVKVSDSRAALVLNYMPSRMRSLIESRYNDNFKGDKFSLYNAYTAAITHDYTSNRVSNVDMHKIILGTYVTKLFSKDFYWEAPKEEILEDLRRKHKINDNIVDAEYEVVD